VHLYSTVQYGKNTDFLDPIPEYIGRSRGTYEECRLDEFIGYRIICLKGESKHRSYC